MSNVTSSKSARKAAAAKSDGGAPKPRPGSGLPLVPWNPWLAALLVVFIYFVSGIASSLLVSIYPALKHIPASQIPDWINNSVGAQFVFVILAETITVGSVYIFLRLHEFSLKDIGLKRPRWFDPLYGLAALPVYFFFYSIAVVVVGYFVPGLNVNQQQDIGFNSVHGPLPLIITFVSLAVLPPLAEEIMVRGFLYSSLKKALPVAWAALGTSALFAAAHLPEGGSGGPLYIAAIDTFVLSLVLIYLRETTGNLWASITLHAAKNSVAFVTLFVLHVH